MSEILYSKEHMWVYREGDTAKVGLSQYALKQLKNIVFISLPEPGETFDVGDTLGDVESVKTVADLVCPVAGEVLEVNEKMLDNPSLLGNTTEDWLVKMSVSSETKDLLTEDEYQKFLVTL